MPPLSKRKVCVVGSGNWGSAIAKIIGSNTPNLENFEDTVTMYVYDEMVNGEKLTEIINTRHENVKYLPGVRLPPNVYAEPDLVTAASGADFLVFVIPHQFIKTICATLKGQIKPTAIGISLIKGFDCAEGGGIDLISHVIHRSLRIQVAVLMGANIANEVALEQFCETTIGCKDKRIGPMLKNLFQTENFRVVVVEDSDTVEVCGALKNVVACAAGFADGLDLGDNTKAAIIRLGLMEMIKFVDEFYPGSQLQTFFESCGLADLVTTCYGGRNRRCAEAFVKSHKGRSVAELEQDLLNGQKLQGPLAAEEVCFMLKKKGQLSNFPLFAAVHKIFQREMEAKDMIEMLKVHPVHLANEIPPEDS